VVQHQKKIAFRLSIHASAAVNRLRDDWKIRRTYPNSHGRITLHALPVYK